MTNNPDPVALAREALATKYSHARLEGVAAYEALYEWLTGVDHIHTAKGIVYASAVEELPKFSKAVIDQDAELNAAKATIEMLSNNDTVRTLVAGLEDVKAGRFVRFEDIDILAEKDARIKELEAALSTSDAALREIAFFVPTVTVWEGMHIANVEQVFRLKKIAGEARAALEGKK